MLRRINDTDDSTVGRHRTAIEGKAGFLTPAPEDQFTRSGTHVVSEFNETKLMSNPRYGYSNIPEKWAVRISDNGEFIHANPASTGAQGNTNVTHGCVNLSLDDAQAYFESAIWGDPVEVSGTSVQLSPDDGDIFDWAFSWDEWKARAVD